MAELERLDKDVQRAMATLPETLGDAGIRTQVLLSSAITSTRLDYL